MNIAQIELIELLGRTPDRPDNVMVVVGDVRERLSLGVASLAVADLVPTADYPCGSALGFRLTAVNGSPTQTLT